MLGSIAGDVVGSPFEWAPYRSTQFPLLVPHSHFTDDTVLTVATAHALLTETPYATAYRTFGRRYPNAGYGGSFASWLRSDGRAPYGSWGNGSAMRVSPVAWAFDSEADVLREAERSAAVTHDHPEGIKGAQAVALAIFLARTGESKVDIRRAITERFGYRLDRTVDTIREGYAFDVSCQGSVPEAIVAFLDADDVEHAIRLAVSLGGDSDTQACIAGAIAEAYWGAVPESLARVVLERLTPDLRDVAERFTSRYVDSKRRRIAQSQ
jgi:ADP-ribosylglycohydrolase